MKRGNLHQKSWFVKTIFVVSLFLILFIAGLGYKHISNVYESQRLVMHTYDVNVQLEQILSYLKDAETGQRGFIITQDSLYLTPFFKGRGNINDTFATLKELTQNNPEQQQNLKELNTLIEKRLAFFEIASTYALKNQTDLLKFKNVFFEGKMTMDAIRAKLNTMILLENERLLKRQKNYKSNTKFTPIFLFGIIVFTLLLLFLAYIRINNNYERLKAANLELEVFQKSTKQSEIINKHASWRWNVEKDEFYFSDNLFRLLGEEPQSFEHTVENFIKYVHPDDLEKLKQQIERMKKEENLPFIRYRVVWKDKSIHYLKAYGKSVINTDGTTQLLGTTSDITDEIDHFNTLEKRNQELELNNKELAAFNYVASHDLQEPLRKIQTFLSRLEDKESNVFSDSGKKYMERINVAASRMRLLIDDLLQYSRTNKSDEVLVKSNINNLLKAAQEDMAEQIIKEEAIITRTELPEMKVIPFQMQQLFANLISNSLKYRSKKESPKILVSHNIVKKDDVSILENGLRDKYHCIAFSDNGIGFEQKYAEKIFTLFSRLHNKDEYSGTGIGLSICKKITDNHGGFITAEGILNEGATFNIYIPK